MTYSKEKTKKWKRNVACVLGSQAISMIGTMLVQYAIVWHITLSTNSGLIVGLMSFLALLPMVLVMPFAGVLADRHNRKKIIMIADGCIAVASLLMAIILTLNGNDAENIWLLLAVVLVRSLGQGFQMPAVSSVIPQITPKKHLVRVNGIDQTIQAVIMLACPALAAALLTFLPLSGILMVDVATAMIGIGVMFFLVRIPNVAMQEKKRNVIREIRSGLRYLRKRRILVALIIVGFATSVLVAPASMLAPLQIVRNFGDDLWRLSFVEIGFAIGMLIGGVLMSLWGGFADKVKTVKLGIFLMILPLVLLGVVSNFWMYLATMLIIGILVPISKTATMAIFQSKTDEAYMGRVMSIVTMLISVATPLAMLVFGPLADAVNIGTIMLVSGGLMILPVLWLIKNKFSCK